MSSDPFVASYYTSHLLFTPLPELPKLGGSGEQNTYKFLPLSLRANFVNQYYWMNRSGIGQTLEWKLWELCSFLPFPSLSLSAGLSSTLFLFSSSFPLPNLEEICSFPRTNAKPGARHQGLPDDQGCLVGKTDEEHVILMYCYLYYSVVHNTAMLTDWGECGSFCWG